jgi:Tol biopolymer transport system component/outer membrane protein assembly factor BamD (BamD/ComL family)
MKSSFKILRILWITILLLTLPAGALYPQETPDQLFEKAVYAEEVKGDLSEAIHLYQSVHEANPENRQLGAKALLHLGLCYEKLGSEQASQAYRDVINKYGDQTTEVALASERISRLQFQTAELNRQAEEHIRAGNESFKRWEYEDAIIQYEQAIKLRPNTLLALNAQYCIGQTWYRAGKYEEAFATLRNLVEENPNSTITPVTELMLSQVQYAMDIINKKASTVSSSGEEILVDPDTGITFNKIKSLTGESDIITYVNDLNLSSNGKFLLFGNIVVPMDGTTPFELIDFNSTGLHVTRGNWSPDGSMAAFFTGDALCVVPVNPETGHTIKPLKKIVEGHFKYQAPPRWSPDGKTIAYHIPDGNIWTVNNDGINISQITDNDINELGPVWSPDGKYIAFGRDFRSIGIYNLNNGSSSEIEETRYRCIPEWSPDGKWFVGDQFGKLHFYDLDRKFNLEFSPPEEAGTFFSWSPDGKKMLFFRTSYFNDSGLKIASPDGGPSYEPVPLLTNWWKARWSADSKFLAVQGEDDQGHIVVRIVPISGGKSELIQIDELPDGKPFPFSVSSNIQQILCSIERNNETEDWYAIPISPEEARTTGPAVKLFTGNKSERPAYLSPDGEQLAIIYQGNIWMAFINGSEPVQLTDYKEEVGYMKWTGDGKALIFSIPSGWRLLENPATDGRVVKLLDDGKEIECDRWDIDVSHKNNLFAYFDNEELKIISLDESKCIRTLNANELGFIEFQEIEWSPDGETLAFIATLEREIEPVSTYHERRYQIYTVSINGGQPIRTANDDDDWKDELSWSPDGKWIAYNPEKPVKVRPASSIWEADFDEVIEKLTSK